MTRVAWRSGALILLVGLGGCAGCGRRAQPRPINVLLISVDTLRRGALPTFSDAADRLPGVERWAARARLYDQAYTPSGWTLPAHASLLTGLYPEHHAATDARLQLAASAPALAAALRQRGLETVAFTDGGFVDRSYGFGRGFSRYDDWMEDPRRWEGVAIPRAGSPSPEPLIGEAPFDRALAYLESRRSGAAPFFLFVHTYAVHNFFQVRPWALVQAREQSVHPWMYYLRCLQEAQACSPDDWRILRALYAAEVRRFDQEFGRFLERLRDLGLEEDTLVVLTADHGEGFDPEHHRIHHGGRLHEDLLRIPLLLAGPGVLAGRSPLPVSLIDVMPTLLDFVGAAIPSGLDGRSFAGDLRGRGNLPARPIYAAEYTGWRLPGSKLRASQPRPSPFGAAVIAGGFWYLRGPEREELYGMETDPGQLRNLASDASLRGRAEALLSAHDFVIHHPLVKHEESGEMAKNLRALGYLQ